MSQNNWKLNLVKFNDSISESGNLILILNLNFIVEYSVTADILIKLIKVPKEVVVAQKLKFGL